MDSLCVFFNHSILSLRILFVFIVKELTESPILQSILVRLSRFPPVLAETLRGGYLYEKIFPSLRPHFSKVFSGPIFSRASVLTTPPHPHGSAPSLLRETLAPLFFFTSP